MYEENDFAENLRFFVNAEFALCLVIYTYC